MEKLIYLENGNDAMNNEVQLPFDLFSRHYIVRNMVNKVFRQGSEKLSILDLGGYAGKTQFFFVDDKVTVLDVYDDNNQKDYVKGDATRLSFSDNTFDIVTNFDVFEHISRKERKKFIKEAFRVSKRAVIMTLPIDIDSGCETSEADKSLDNFYKTLTGKRHPWLREHTDNGIPTIDEFENLLNCIGIEFIKISSNSLDTWKMMQVINFLGTVDEFALEQSEKLNEQYNTHIESIENNINDGYRAIYILFKDNKYAEQSINKVTLNSVGTKSIDGNKFRKLVFNSMIQIVADNMKRHKKAIDNCDKIKNDFNMLSRQYQYQKVQINNLEIQLNKFEGSSSWRLTAPLRKVKELVKKVASK